MPEDFNVKKHNRFLLIFFLVMLIPLTLFLVVITQTRYRDSKTLSLKNNISIRDFISDSIEQEEIKIHNGTSTLPFINTDDPDVPVKIPVNDLKSFQIVRMQNLNDDMDNEVLYYMYYYDNKIYYKTFENLEVFVNNQTYYLFIVDEDGNTVYSSDPSSSKNISEYIEDSDVFINALHEEEQFVKKVNSYFYSFAKINDSDFFLFQVIPSDFFVKELNYVYISLVIFIMFGFMLYYFAVKTQNKKDLQILNELIISQYDDFYIITVNKKGRVIRYNQLFEHIFKEDDDNLLNFIKNKEINLQDKVIIINHKQDFYEFKNISYGKKHILIGENYSTIIEKQNLLIYRNELSLLPSLKSFELHVNSLNPVTNHFFMIIKLDRAYNITELYANDNFIKIANSMERYIKQSFVKYNPKLFHTSTDIFILVLENYETQMNRNNIKTRLDDIKLIIEQEVFINVEFNAGIVVSTMSELDNPNKLYHLLNNLIQQSNDSFDKILYFDKDFKNYYNNYEIMKVDIENAVVNDEFMIYLQPILNVKTNKIAAFESLLRWDNDKYRKTSPAEYISVAENTNLIYQVGKVVVQKSLSAIEKMNDENMVVSINVSPKQLLENGFIDSLITTCINKKIRFNQVAIEITESVFVESFTDVVKKLEAIYRLGFKIYLDDFGTGYNSLKYLKDLPVTTIKIDSSFIRNILQDNKAYGIVESIIQLAHSLKMDVVAEGVETEEELKLLKKLGADYIQGYFISRPKPVDEVIKEFLVCDLKENN